MKNASVCIVTSALIAMIGLALEPFVHWRVMSEFQQLSNPAPHDLVDRLASVAWVKLAGWIMIGIGVVGTITAGMFWLIAGRESTESRD